MFQKAAEHLCPAASFRGLQPHLCKDYKKDIFAVFAYDFEPSHNFQVLEKSMFYASFPTIAPGLGGSDFTALLRAFGDREI